MIQGSHYSAGSNGHQMPVPLLESPGHRAFSQIETDDEDFESAFDAGADRLGAADGDDDPELADGADDGADEALEPEPDFASMTLSALDDVVGTLAGHLNAGNYRLLSVVAQMDLRDQWADLGYLSGAHYLNGRCGIALGPAREKVRTARALEHLPLIAEQFRRGRLSYSKVRALTRVATAEDEPQWLQTAMNGTATHVERIVRHRRQAAAAADPVLRLQSRMCTSYWDDDGMLVIHARLPAEQGAVFRKAIDQAIDDVSTAGAELEDQHRANARADALVRVCEGFLEHDGGAGNAADRYMVCVDVPAGTLVADPTQAVTPDELPALELEGPPLSLHTLRRLCCDASIVAREDPAPSSLPRRTRTIPAALRRSLRRRDGGCRFPGCTNTRFVDAHHIVPWMQGGETTAQNLVLLCRRHHTYVHEYGYRIEGQGQQLRFFGPNSNQEIEAVGDRRSRGNVRGLMNWNIEEGIVITPDTATAHRRSGGSDDHRQSA